MTVSGDRPGYLAETLDSWSAVRGLSSRPFHFVVEPGDGLARCRAVIEDFSRRQVARAVEVEVNAERRGVRANPHHALATAFATGAASVVLCEEDIVVGDDVLECLEAVPDDPDVLAACAFSTRPDPQPEDVLDDTGFSAWVWSTWADRWSRFLCDDWFEAARAPWDGAGAGWDFGVERIAARAGLRFVGPLASRSDNIGRDGGVHALPEEFEASRAPTFRSHRDPVAWRTPLPARGEPSAH
ncbi:hypothetical protein [Actinomycetospora corticicola]|uniref:Glycosyl transferase family 2 n=1 Tax=Actinomycetospora corticicola TaxID=663602 RepID=A0A7Y9DZY0_9PSEU|nr:hypothetical protein [Actinomycetospora corticicola]NYD38517.1 hypothetical protein [Actinomycetospora corticicola]